MNSLRHYALGRLRILAPQDAHSVRPVVHTGGFASNFTQFPKLLGLVNGTFFGSPVGGPNLFGDHLTDREKAWGFLTKPSEQVIHQGLPAYFRPATVVAKPGYKLRWGVGAIDAGRVAIQQGQPSQLAEVTNFQWFIGGAALILQNGKRPPFPSKPGDPLGLTGAVGGEFQTDVLGRVGRSLLLVTQDDRLHLAACLNSSPSEASDEARKAGYKHALMMDGGGSTLLAYKPGVNQPRRSVVSTTRILQSFVGIFQGDRPVVETQDDWPNLSRGSCGDAVTSLQLLLSLQPSGSFDSQTAVAVLEHRSKAGLPAVEQADRTFWETLPQLTAGSKGPAVEACQFLLVYAMGSRLQNFGPSNDGVDGDYGSLTTQSIVAVRRNFGLPAHDLVDHSLWKALLNQAIQ